MDLATFWAIIETSRIATADLPLPPGGSSMSTVEEASARGALERFAQTNRLTGALSRLSEEELKAFIIRFQEVSSQAERWDIVGAASILGQGSDDGFVYFRCWLIAQGRETFEAALADPDSLASEVPETVWPGAFDFQDFCYVPHDVLADKVGEDAASDFPALTMPQNPLRGEPTDFDDDALVTEHYPNLIEAAERAWTSFSRMTEATPRRP